jgi:hypothetical protein
MIQLDKLMLVYGGDSGDPNRQIACALADGALLKKHLQHLRGLARHTERSRDVHLQSLKDCVMLASSETVPSPNSSVTAVSPSSSEETPVAKRSRTGHLASRPPKVEVDEHAVVLATPSAQSTIASGGGSKADSPPKWCLEGQEIFDENRAVPENFDANVHSAFMRIPPECCPQPEQKLAGKSNFTIKDSASRAVQVHLRNKAPTRFAVEHVGRWCPPVR